VFVNPDSDKQDPGTTIGQVFLTGTAAEAGWVVSPTLRFPRAQIASEPAPLGRSCRNGSQSNCEGVLRFSSYFLIDFLRGQPINHDTQPNTSEARSMPARKLDITHFAAVTARTHPLAQNVFTVPQRLGSLKGRLYAVLTGFPAIIPGDHFVFKDFNTRTASFPKP
jgi:hypothetical protein